MKKILLTLSFFFLTSYVQAYTPDLGGGYTDYNVLKKDANNLILEFLGYSALKEVVNNMAEPAKTKANFVLERNMRAVAQAINKFTYKNLDLPYSYRKPIPEEAKILGRITAELKAGETENAKKWIEKNLGKGFSLGKGSIDVLRSGEGESKVAENFDIRVDVSPDKKAAQSAMPEPDQVPEEQEVPRTAVAPTPVTIQQPAQKQDPGVANQGASQGKLGGGYDDYQKLLSDAHAAIFELLNYKSEIQAVGGNIQKVERTLQLEMRGVERALNMFVYQKLSPKLRYGREIPDAEKKLGQGVSDFRNGDDRLLKAWLTEYAGKTFDVRPTTSSEAEKDVVTLSPLQNEEPINLPNEKRLGGKYHDPMLLIKDAREALFELGGYDEDIRNAGGKIPRVELGRQLEIRAVERAVNIFVYTKLVPKTRYEAVYAEEDKKLGRAVTRYQEGDSSLLEEWARQYVAVG